MTLRELSQSLAATFAKFDDPTLEARHLLTEALSIDMSELVLGGDNDVSPTELQIVEKWKSERVRGVPLAYLSGHKGFYKYDFIVRPGVLVPRPETELVVTEALRRAPGSLRLLDMGCGSGCIGLSLVKDLKYARLTAVDSSSAAISVSRENATRLGVADRVTFVPFSVERWAPSALEEANKSGQYFDLVVGNPPYIAEGDPKVETHVHDHEPKEALYAAEDGLATLRSWISNAFGLLRPGGTLVLEFGSGQSPRVMQIMEQAGFRELVVKNDLGGHDRVISGFKPG